MVAWVVLDRRHYRQAGPFALPLSTPLFPLPHLSPLLSYSYGHSYTTTTHQPLCNQSLTHSFAHFCIFLRSPKTQLPCFQSFPHSLRKTTQDGVPPKCPARSRGQAAVVLLGFRPILFTKGRIH